jgi:phasin family protein
MQSDANAIFTPKKFFIINSFKFGATHKFRLTSLVLRLEYALLRRTIFEAVLVSKTNVKRYLLTVNLIKEDRMSTLPEQFSEATKANLDAQLAILSSLTSKAIESVEKVVELNLAVARNSFEESNATVKQLISAKDPQEFFSVTTAQTQPNAEKASEYARHLASILSSAQAELTKVTEAHVADTNRKIVSLVEELSRHAPAGSEQAIALLKSAIGSANASYEQINKSTKQAVEVLESNLNSAVTHIAKTTTKATRGSRKA